MAIEEEADEAFRKGFELVNKMPKTARREDILKRVIECGMRMWGIKPGQSLTLKDE